MVGVGDDRAAVRAEVGRALQRLVSKFGPGVLESPERLQGLLNDELGVDAASARADVAMVVTAVRTGAQIPAGHGDLGTAATMVANAAPGAPPDVVRWSVELLSRLRGSAPEVGATVLPLPAPHVAGAERDRSSWPTAARVAVAGAAVAAVLMGIMGFAIGASRDDSSAESPPTEDVATTSGSSSNDRVSELRRERDELRAQVDGLAAQVGSLEQDLESSRAETAAAAARADAFGAAFPAEMSALQTADPSGSYRITGTRVTCSYGNCDTTSGELSMSGYIEPAGGAWQLVVPGYVSIPVGWNGFVLTGSAPTTSTGTCRNAAGGGQSAGMRVSVAAVDVDESGRLQPTRLVGTWEDYIPSVPGCREAGSSYDVVLTRD